MRLTIEASPSGILARVRTSISKMRRAVGMRIAGVKAAVTTWPSNFTAWSTLFTNAETDKLAAYETVFAAASRLSNSVGSLPVGLYDGEYRRQSIPVSDLLTYSPNANMHRFEFFRTLEALRCGYGNGIALKDYDSRAQVRALNIIDPTRVTPLIEKTSRELWYQIAGDNGGYYYVHNMDVIHVKHVSTIGAFSGLSYWGISPLAVLAGTTDFDSKVREFSLDQVESAVKASFILKIGTLLDTGVNADGTIDTNSKLYKTLESFKSFYAENGGVLIQQQGMEIEPIIQKSFFDTKALDTDKVTRKRVAEVFGLPDPDATGYNSREQEALRYIQDTLVPIASQYESEFDRKLLTPAERRSGMHFKLNLYSLLRADMATQADYFFKMVRTGLMVPDEARAKMEYPPLPNGIGSKPYMSRDLSPVGSTPPVQ